MRYLVAAVMALFLAGCTNTLTPENLKLLAASCETGQTTYGFIVAASTTGTISPKLKGQADQLYAVLDGLCKKGSAATQTDIVLAGAQVYALVKVWRDAT